MSEILQIHNFKAQLNEVSLLSNDSTLRNILKIIIIIIIIIIINICGV